MHLHTGTHAVQQLLGMQVNMDTIFTTWLTALIVFLVVFAASRGKKLVPTGVQNCVEILIEALLDQFKTNVGPKYRQVVPALLTLFLFILTANQLGLLPTDHMTASPTSDINTTLGLALAVTILIHALYIANQGVGKWVFVLINLVEEISRPVTLAMRLFGNILAGEILLELLYALAPWLIPIIWIAFSVFVGVIQAYIFTTLSSVYLKHSL